MLAFYIYRRQSSVRIGHSHSASCAAGLFTSKYPARLRSGCLQPFPPKITVKTLDHVRAVISAIERFQNPTIMDTITYRGS